MKTVSVVKKQNESVLRTEAIHRRMKVLADGRVISNYNMYQS
jgi:hypothetical protein